MFVYHLKCVTHSPRALPAKRSFTEEYHLHSLTAHVCSPSLHHAQPQHDQHNPAAAAEEPALQAVAHNDAETKNQNTAAMQATLPAHKNTPCASYAGGVKKYEA